MARQESRIYDSNVVPRSSIRASVINYSKQNGYMPSRAYLKKGSLTPYIFDNSFFLNNNTSVVERRIRMLFIIFVFLANEIHRKMKEDARLKIA